MNGEFLKLDQVFLLLNHCSLKKDFFAAMLLPFLPKRE
jgi:hypothetical protein